MSAALPISIFSAVVVGSIALGAIVSSEQVRRGDFTDPGVRAFDEALEKIGVHRLSVQPIFTESMYEFTHCPVPDRSMGGVAAVGDKDGGVGSYAVCLRADGTAYVNVEHHYTKAETDAATVWYAPEERRTAARIKAEKEMAEAARRDAAGHTP